VQPVNCPQCQSPMDRGVLRTEWLIVHDQTHLDALRKVDAADEKLGSSVDVYGGRAFHIAHRNHPKGEKKFHCFFCARCRVVLFGSSDLIGS
jgi:hypothetical protein